MTRPDAAGQARPALRFLPVQDTAILVELADLDQMLALLGALRREPIAGLRECVPAARTLLVQFEPARITAAELVDRLAALDLDAEPERGGQWVEIPVHYDGEDLDELAGILGIAPAELIRRHTASEYVVAFTGFAPGFAYLSGGDPIFDVPRRATPRTRVPAGAVALGGAFSAVYPQASPGGWQLIGRTPARMWDLTREPPALLQPGYRVRFVVAPPGLAPEIASIPEIAPPPEAAPASEAALTPETAARAPETAEPASAPGPVGDSIPSPRGALDVRATGLLTLFQDRGRHGRAGQGVSASGAMDQAAFKEANRLVGNPSDLPVLETVGGGLALQSIGDTVVAVTGADAPLTVTTPDGRPWQAARHQALALADGYRLSIGPPRAGLRCYLAARGGFEVAPVLGSASTDTLAQLGPAPLAAGQRLRMSAAAAAAVAEPGLPPDSLPQTGLEVVLDIMLGPRADWFTPEAVERLSAQRWQVTPLSNRIGLRLAGEHALTRAIERELPSEATVNGAIQIPPDGQPVLFLADHPLTGGYPVIACLAPHHLDLAGQIPVGAWIRFRPIRGFQPYTPRARGPAG